MEISNSEKIVSTAVQHSNGWCVHFNNMVEVDNLKEFWTSFMKNITGRYDSKYSAEITKTISTNTTSLIKFSSEFSARNFFW